MPPFNHDLSHLDGPVQEERPRKRSPYFFLGLAILASLIVHLIFVVTGSLLPGSPGSLHYDSPMRTHVVTLPRQNEQQKQVVNTPKPKAEQESPDNPDFLAEHNQKVKEQTRSRVTDIREAKLSSKAVAGKTGDKSGGPSQKVSENGLLAKKSPLFPTWKDAGFDGSSPSNDYLRNVQEDAETKLNTAEWAHASFFNRVKQAISRRWNPNKAVKRNDPNGALIGRQDRATRVMASIDSEGKLLSLKVLRESGIFFLDDEAMRAFQEAAPFSNPPKALFARNDTFEFSFGFVLTFEKGFKFDLDWRP